MKKSLIKNYFESIYVTRRRFISILIMAFLGVGFFAGLTASSPDMQDTLEHYLDENNMHDISVISTMGLNNEDIETLKEIDGIKEVYGIQTKDTEAKLGEVEKAIKVIEYSENINLPTLIEGRMPENESECLIDEGYNRYTGEKSCIGEKLILENSDVDEDKNPIFTTKEFEIVGVAASPLYIGKERGTTSVGNGSIDFYIYTKNSVINMDYFTEAGIIVEGAKELETNGDAYLRLINNAADKIKGIQEEREQARYNSIIDKANQKLADAQKEFDDKKAEAESKILDAEDKLNNAKTEIEESEVKIEDAKKEIEKNTKKANTEFANAEKQIKNAEEQITIKEKELQEGKKALEENRAQANAGIQQLENAINTSNATIQNLQEQKKQLEIAGMDTTQIDAGILQAQNAKKGLEQQKNQIQTQLTEAENKIKSRRARIKQGKTRVK